MLFKHFARIIILNSDCAIAYNDIHCARVRICHVRMEPKLFHQTLFPRAIKYGGGHETMHSVGGGVWAASCGIKAVRV